ncbi:hypothetical protein VNO77_21954 [Canavalia gladiata]|uniref:Dof zinc finger protein n=1 Tax=Canavalia gladiata TaxID=3824 RepID=A0AAN9QA24_CANGL
MMEQEGSGRGGGEGDDINKQTHQDRRVKEMQQGEGIHTPPQQPQKCPRCDSLNTKFCYYNNYSLSQPRYFCKTCRRYWTQGGTLRNVPVGGGCRKGKRAKNSSSSADNSSRSQPQPPPQEVVQSQPPLTTMVRAKDPSSVLASPFYQGGVVGGGDGGYLSSLAAIHNSLNPSHPFDQSLNVGGDAVRSSNLGLLSGFNVGPQRPIRPPQMYGNEREVVSLYTTEQGLINSSSMPNSSAVSHHDWPHSFINNNNNNNNVTNRASDASLWSTISTTSIGANSERTGPGGGAASTSSLVPNQWPNLPGYGPPP